MKIAVVSESPADEAAVKVLADAILGSETDLISSLRIRTRGWPSVFNLLPSIIKHLHYNSDADGFVTVVDSDESVLHEKSHEVSGAEDSNCRLCQLRGIINREFSRLSLVPNKNSLKVALGLAVPAIEAWYCCDLDPHVTEFEWARKLRGERLTYDKKSLKVLTYGSDPVSILDMMESAKIAAQRVTTQVDLLERSFPGGFGCFVRDLRGW